MLTGVIARFATGTYTVSRNATGSLDDSGRWIEGGVASTFSTVASIQPVSGRELKTFPESRQAEETKVVYAVEDLRIKDIITINSEPWEVFRVSTWEAFGGTHRVAYIARQVAGGS